MPQSQLRSSTTGAAGAAARETQKKKSRGVALTKRRAKYSTGKPAKSKRQVTLASKLHKQMNAKLSANTEMQMLERAVHIDGRRFRVLKPPTSKERKANSEAIKATKKGTIVREKRQQKDVSLSAAERRKAHEERQGDAQVDEIIEELGVGSDDEEEIEQSRQDALEKARSERELKNEETRHLNDVLFTESVFD